MQHYSEYFTGKRSSARVKTLTTWRENAQELMQFAVDRSPWPRRDRMQTATCSVIL